MGPVLFCLTLHPILTSLTSELRLGYLDDVSLGGDESSILHDLRKISQGGKEIGLNLNVSKCEVVQWADTIDLEEFSDFSSVHPNDASLLGAPILPGRAMDHALSVRCSDLARAIDRLKLLSSHDALVILKSALSTPKLLYTLRSSPCSDHPELERFDALLRSGLSGIINISISDVNWIQASLPVSDGGLGIRSAALLAPSAFLASAAGTRNLQSNILLLTTVEEDPWISHTRQIWTARYSATEPSADEAHLQRSWDRASIEHATAILLQHATSDRDRARLLAVATPHSGDWLHALPIASCGLRLDDESIRVAIGLRLGTPICAAHSCNCGAWVDNMGTHGLSCRLGTGRLARHQQINDLVWRALERASIPSCREPKDLMRDSEMRPDGLTLIPWKEGKCLTWDVTVADTFAATYVAATSIKAGEAAARLAANKREKYAELTHTHLFCPIAVETMGPVEEEGRDLLSAIGHQICKITGDPRETSFLFQRLSVIIQRGNAAAFRGTFPRPCSDF